MCRYCQEFMKREEAHTGHQFTSLPFHEGEAPRTLFVEGATGYPRAGVPAIVSIRGMR
jgi:hypothetical protein